MAYEIVELDWVPQEQGPYTIYRLKEWENLEFEYGFTGAGADFSAKNLNYEAERFCSAIGTDSLFLPKQVHSGIVLNPYDEFSAIANEEADAFVVDLNLLPSNVACGVRTADCLAILVKINNLIALIHAGWRGLASRVIENTFGKLTYTSGDKIEVLISPAAGKENYCVGPEVIEQIGSETCVFEERAGNIFLDLTATSIRQIQIQAVSNSLLVLKSDSCTITDKRFHSYRRDAELSGRNLFYIKSKISAE